MKKNVSKMILFLFLFTIILTGCEDESEKNIFHSQWNSSDGYKILIADPKENSEISKESCAVYMGNDSLGLCTVDFNKTSGTVKIVWTYFTCKSSLNCQKTDSVTISNDTKSFTLNGITFTYNNNLTSNK